jgi:hypothetical protein
MYCGRPTRSCAATHNLREKRSPTSRAGSAICQDLLLYCDMVGSHAGAGTGTKGEGRPGFLRHSAIKGRVAATIGGCVLRGTLR